MSGRCWSVSRIRVTRSRVPVRSDARRLSNGRRRARWATCPLLFVLAIACAPSWGQSPQPARGAERTAVVFERDIRPIFRQHCIKCHGPEQREAGLRLDDGRAALAGGDSGRVIVPGKANQSLLIRLVSGADPDRVMPPEGPRLDPEKIELLKRWIDAGAAWPIDADKPIRQRSDHWAFQPVRRPSLPSVRRADACRTPIDRFIQAKLEAEGVAPSPPADRHTLIRRLYLDLIGLPPDVADVDAFVNDPRPDAWERLVDRLLASPRFGERWGRHWLDKARYADSDGYEKDRPRPDAWRYRDWVIDAINRDMPFDAFTVEQLAGDLLPDAGPMEQLATAFHRQTLTNTEGGTDQEQFRVEAVFDRVETTAAVWMGLTATCARCHSHKYDPLPQREYYQVFAFFNNGDEANAVVPVLPPELHARAVAEHRRQLAEQQRRLAKAHERVLPRLPAWEESVREKLRRYRPLKAHTVAVTEIQGPAGVRFERQDDGSWLVLGAHPLTGDYVITFRIPGAEVSGLRLEFLPDERLPARGPGRAANGNFVLSELIVRVPAAARTADAPPEPADRAPRPVDHAVPKLVRAVADFAQDGYPAKNAIDGDERTGWAIAPQMGKPHRLDVFFSAPIRVAAASSPAAATGSADRRTQRGTPSHDRPEATPSRGQPAADALQVVLRQRYAKSPHTIGRFRISALTGSPEPPPAPEPIAAILATPPPRRTPDQVRRLREFFLSQQPEVQTEQRRLEQIRAAAPPTMSVRVIRQRTQNPRTTYVLRRGDFLQPITDQPVRPGVFSVLPPIRFRDPQHPDRLDFARWLVRDDHPLTPRVTVNHVWVHLFGAGIVPTVNDFGTRGEPPSHPRLLDWLAHRFVHEMSWSRKRLIREIVCSAAYRRSAADREDLRDRDPKNRWLARQNRFRVEAEIIRDMALQVAGLLSDRIGGPSVFPPMPPDVAALSYANNFKWNTSTGEDRYRRGMYTFFKRTAPHPNLITFDCPDANVTALVRNRSNTPLQALTTWNNEVFVEAAQAFSKRIFEQPLPGTDARLVWAFRTCLARPPDAHELRILTRHHWTARNWYAEHESDALRMIGRWKAAGAAPADQAAWVVTARVLLNLDEFLVRP
ncbi:MAG: DUF1549 domain-containing protein [Planctomycetota bacterium]|nr:MAG: DUF1549 domain-containing protein [Planctomycetota bacterium]